MASNFIPLQEAAQRLGIPTDRLVEMRSQGEIRGFRDGASWKFPEAEIERVKAEMADVLDEAPSGGSSLLVSEDELGGTGSSKSKVIGGDQPQGDSGSGTGSDVGVGDEASPVAGSDVNLVARQGDDQDVELVQSGSDAPSASEPAPADDDDELRLQDDDDELKIAADDAQAAPQAAGAGDTGQPAGGSKIESDLKLESDPMEGSDANLDLLDEDLSLASDPNEGEGSDKENVLSGIDLTDAEAGGTGDLIHGDSDPAIESADVGSGAGGEVDDALSDDDDLVISDDDDDDLVLGGAGSDISIAGDSGINLMSPSDSGLSLESEPLDLAGSSISALDLGAELDDGGSGGGSGIGSGSGSLVDFQADEEFQLSPSGVDMDADDESGSQVIEVEDSQAFGSDVNLGEGGLEGDVFGEADVVEDEAVIAEGALDADDAMAVDDMGVDPHAEPAAGPAARPVYEVPFSVFNVITLACVLLIMCLGGMLMTDLMRNMWTYSETSAPVSSLTDALVDMAGLGQ